MAVGFHDIAVAQCCLVSIYTWGR